MDEWVNGCILTLFFIHFVIPARIKIDITSAAPLPGTVVGSIPYIRSHYL